MRKLYGIGLFFLLSACASGPEPPSPETFFKVNPEKALSVVQLETAKFGVFEKEISSSGKLKARNKADLSFPFEGRITDVFVRNGQQVQKGLLLARLDTFDLRIALDKAFEQEHNAVTEMQDQLLLWGYDLKDSIPPEKWAMVRQQNGYNAIQLDIQSIRHQLKEAQIRAPFSGVIANMEAKAYNQSSRYDKLCTLIDSRSLEVEFQVMESEYALVKPGQSIELQAFYDADKTYQGVISQINPTIDEHGMLKVWATVRNSNARLLEGMNVKVKIKKSIPRKIIIPKSAVVNRQNRQVVFTFEENVSKWNYVELGWENSRNVTVESGLQAGQQVIVSGNLDLAHNVVVVVDSMDHHFGKKQDGFGIGETIKK